jgi:hypothetical protein
MITLEQESIVHVYPRFLRDPAATHRTSKSPEISNLPLEQTPDKMMASADE